MRVDRYMYIIIEVLTRINHDTYMSSPASASCANRTDQKGRKKEKKKGRLWTTDANRLQITVNLKKMRHLRRAFRRFWRKFTSKLQVLYARKTLRFSTIRPKLLMLILQIANITALLRAL